MSEVLNERFILGAYWSGRYEPLDACVERLVSCLSEMASLSPIFDGWYRKGASRASAGQNPVELSTESLRALLAAGQQRKDHDLQAMSELGFNAALWNRRPDRTAAWSVTCGLNAGEEVGLLNSFVLTWPERSPGSALEGELVLATAALRVIVRTWNPDWATWTTRTMREVQRAGVREPVLGLVTYLGRTGTMDKLEQVASVESFAGGQLVSIDPYGPDLLGRLTRIRKTLQRAGALAPPF